MITDPELDARMLADIRRMRARGDGLFVGDDVIVDEEIDLLLAIADERDEIKRDLEAARSALDILTIQKDER